MQSVPPWPRYVVIVTHRADPPPAPVAEPWDLESVVTHHQTVVRGFGNDPSAALAAALTPVVWLWTDRLRDHDDAWRYTHLALELPGLRLPMATLEHLRHVVRPVHVGLRLPPEPCDLRTVLQVLQTLGVHTVVLLAADPWIEAEAALRGAFPSLDVRRIGPPLR